MKLTDSHGNESNTLTVSSFTIDTTPPQISQVTPVSSPTNDTTPTYTFNSNEAGTITITGATSSTTNATIGNNTLTFNALSDGTYNNITIKVTDSLGYESNTLTVPQFTIDTTLPQISQVTPVTTPTTDTNSPIFIFN